MLKKFHEYDFAKSFRKVVFIAVLLVIVPTQVVGAEGYNAAHAIFNWPFWNPFLGCSNASASATAANAGANPAAGAGGTGVNGTNFPTPNYTAFASYPAANPVNGADIMDYLHKNGFTWIAAAGAVASMWGESKWDPEAAGTGGWGLMGWTGNFPDARTGNATKDMNMELPLILKYVSQFGDQQYVDQMNKVTSVADAANIWGPKVEKFGINDVHPEGIAAATAIMNQLMSGTAPSAVTGGGGGASSVGSAASTLSNATGATGGGSASCCSSSASAAATPANTSGTFSSLTGDSAISGTFVLGFDVNTYSKQKNNLGDIDSIFKKYKPAGIYILGTNVPGGGQSAASYGFDRAFFEKLATDAGHPIITASDEEGLYTRYTYNFNFPTAGAMSKMSSSTGNPNVQDIGKKVGQAMLSNGLNTDLAPVLDVGTGNNSDFHQQADRTFGTNFTTVEDKANAFATGLRAGNVNPVYKHFPGLGSSTGNTDNGPVTSPDITTLEANDLQPYSQLVNPNTNSAAVMMDNAHIPGLTAGPDVASTSKAAVDLLRGKYGFSSGLIMTDDLIAKGVGLAPDDALVAALKAGVDAPLEAYQNNGVLDAAITKIKAASPKIDTTAALERLDQFVPPVSGSTSSSPSPSSSPSTSPSGGSGGINSGSVYILGDSITEITTPTYTSAFKAKGITANIDASSSRSINGPGVTQNKLSGMQAIAADASQIKSAGAIVVALGTNQGASSSDIQSVIKALRADNANAPIYWVNVISVGRTDNYNATITGPTNTALANQASPLKYSVVDWFDAVNKDKNGKGGSGTPTSPGTTQDPNNYIGDKGSLGVHPTAAGQTALANLVVSAVTGGSAGGSNPASAPPAAACCQSSGSATGSIPSTGSSSGPLVTFYDSTNPGAFPGSATSTTPKHTATYTTSFTYLPGSAIGIAQSSSLQSNMSAVSKSNALDIEPNAATPSMVVPWVTARAKVSNGIILLYSDKADWPSVKAAAGGLPSNIQSHVRYWVADLGSPQVTPGAWGTQYVFGSGYDTSVTTAAGWAELVASPPTASGGGVTGASSGGSSGSCASSGSGGSTNCASASGTAKILCAAQAYKGIYYEWAGGHQGYSAFKSGCPNPASPVNNQPHGGPVNGDPAGLSGNPSPCGLDCSGLVSIAVDDAFKQTFSWTTSTIPGSGQWKQIPWSQAQPGDIALSSSHVEIVAVAPGSASQVQTWGAHQTGDPIGPATLSTGGYAAWHYIGPQ